MTVANAFLATTLMMATVAYAADSSRAKKLADYAKLHGRLYQYTEAGKIIDAHSVSFPVRYEEKDYPSRLEIQASRILMEGKMFLGILTSSGATQAQSVQPRMVNTLDELARIAAESPTSAKYDLYKIGERYQIYFFQVKSFEPMLDYLGRVLIWSDLQGLPGLGDGVVNNLDDHVKDGVSDMKDVRFAVRAVWPGGEAGGLTYDLAHVVNVFNAYATAPLPSVLGEGEREFLDKLEEMSLISRMGKLYRVVKSASLVMMQPTRRFPVEPEYVVRHELSHAVMYQDPRFRVAALGAWKSLKPVEQQAIKSRMRTSGLNVDNFELLIEEFAAYSAEGFDDPMFTSFRIGQPLSEKVSAATITRLKDLMVNAVELFNPFKNEGG